jgi:hypothetical protein
MYCRKCGAAIGDDDLFCTDCGADTGTKSDQNQNQDEKVEDSSTESSSSADAAPTDTRATTVPAAYTGQVSRPTRTAVKPGAERIWGLVLIIAAALCMVRVVITFNSFVFRFLLEGRGWTVQSAGNVMYTLLTIESILMPIALLLAVILGAQLFRGLSGTALEKKRLRGLALPDVITGSAFVLYFLTVFLNYVAFHAENSIAYLCASILVCLLPIGAAIPYFMASRAAKSVEGLSSILFIVSAITLCIPGFINTLIVIYCFIDTGNQINFPFIYISDLFPSLYNYYFGSFGNVEPTAWLLVSLSSALASLTLSAFFIIRGIFWFGAARRLSGSSNAVKSAPVQNPPAQNVQAATNSNTPGTPMPPSGGYGTQAVAAELSGGNKFGYFALGFFLGVVGVLIAWLTNKDKPIEKPAIKMSVIGLVVSGILLCTCSCIVVVLPFALGAL